MVKLNELIDLWQSPQFNGVKFNFYKEVNYFMRNDKPSATKEDIKKLGFANEEKYVAHLHSFIANFATAIRTPRFQLNEKLIVYRGEKDTKISSISNSFMSVTDEISIAYEFADCSKKISTLYVILLPKGSYALPIKKHFAYKTPDSVFERHEHEYILPPYSCFDIISTNKIKSYGVNLQIVKMILVHQSDKKITNRSNLTKTKSKIVNFKDSKLNTFYSLLNSYDKASHIIKHIKTSLPVELMDFIAWSPHMFNIFAFMTVMKEFDELLCNKNNQQQCLHKLHLLLTKWQIKLYNLVPQSDNVAHDIYETFVTSFRNFKKGLHLLKKLQTNYIPCSLRIKNYHLYAGLQFCYGDSAENILHQKFMNSYFLCHFDENIVLNQGFTNNLYPNNYFAYETHKQTLCYNNVILDIKIINTDIFLFKFDHPTCFGTTCVILWLGTGYIIKTIAQKKNKWKLPITYIKMEI